MARLLLGSLSVPECRRLASAHTPTWRRHPSSKLGSPGLRAALAPPWFILVGAGKAKPGCRAGRARVVRRLGTCLLLGSLSVPNCLRVASAPTPTWRRHPSSTPGSPGLYAAPAPPRFRSVPRGKPSRAAGLGGRGCWGGAGAMSTRAKRFLKGSSPIPATVFATVFNKSRGKVCYIPMKIRRLRPDLSWGRFPQGDHDARS